MSETEGVIEVNEPQVWTLIGVFAASMFAMMGLITGMFTRVLRAEIGGLRGEMNARFETVSEQFGAVQRQLDALDRDVQALTKRVFERPE